MSKSQERFQKGLIGLLGYRVGFLRVSSELAHSIQSFFSLSFRHLCQLFFKELLPLHIICRFRLQEKYSKPYEEGN